MCVGFSLRFLAFVLATLATVRALPGPRSLQYDPAIVQALGGLQAPPLGDSSFTCRVLSIALRAGNSTVSVQADPNYTSLEDDNFSTTCWLPAACIVSPRTTGEVSRVLAILSTLNTKFATRSGGHSDVPGFASIGDEGVLISLASLTAIQLARDNRSVRVGPGNRWQAVYSALAPHQLTAIGGRVGTVGVGGFLLGGGISYFASRYGLGLDNIKSFEVVLGDGSVVIATADNAHSDLYKGLRGGAANFGIVTAFELYTHPLGTIYYEARAYGLNQSSEFLHALADYQTSGQLDPLSSATIQMQENGASVLLLYSQPAYRPSAFDSFYQITPFLQILPPVNGTLVGVIELVAAGFATQIRSYGETFSHKVDGDFMAQIYGIFAEEIADLPAGATGTWVPTALAASMVEKGKQHGGNLLGLEEIPQQWHEWFLTWTDPSQDVAIHAIAARITQRCTDAARAKGLLLPYLFMNTAGGTQDVLGSFGATNVEAIRRTAAKYDPRGVFQNLQNDGYLVRKLG